MEFFLDFLAKAWRRCSNASALNKELDFLINAFVDNEDRGGIGDPSPQNGSK